MIKNLFNISDLTNNLLFEILKKENKKNFLRDKTIGLLFEKYSTRTRLSFQVGIHQLGGSVINIRPEELNISRGESFEDTFKAMSCYMDGLIYRTFDHERLIRASKYFEKPIINALSDISHPCQTLGDLYTIMEYFNSFKINILWIGDMNNVCYSLVQAANLINDINLFICTPISISQTIKWPLSSNISIFNDINEFDLKSINCVMTDVFISMNDNDDSKKIELLKPFKVTSEIMSRTSTNSVFMHCLPAKVGYEVTDEVLRSSKSIVWKQAYNRMVAQKKLLQFIYE